jgi:hypothetical protein
MILQKHVTTPEIFDLFENVHIHGITIIVSHRESAKDAIVIRTKTHLDLLKEGDTIMINSETETTTVLSCIHYVVLMDDVELINRDKHGLFVLYKIQIFGACIELYISYADNEYVEMCYESQRYIASCY